MDKFDKGDSISDYFYGLLSFNENQYEESFKFLRKLDGLEISHADYSVKYLYSRLNGAVILTTKVLYIASAIQLSTVFLQINL